MVSANLERREESSFKKSESSLRVRDKLQDDELFGRINVIARGPNHAKA